MNNDHKNENDRPMKSKIRIIGGAFYLIFLLLILSFLILSNVNLYISILLIIFLFLLGVGPIISGFNKQRLHNLFHRREPQLKKLEKDPIKRVNNVTLNFEYKTELLKKCSKCGMLLIGSLNRCPNCGNNKFD
ncbi:MAG: hypothetical protein EU531_01700 [Promethearchaeota archaeon]|nr:MAG: hypothetical protein EU531_01700 [Candidatus Lokiarchaeota archaeon]